MKTLQRFGCGLVLLLLAEATLMAEEPRKEAPELTAEQRQELEKLITAKEKEAAKAVEAEEFDKARTRYKEVLELITRLYGEADWRVTNPRIALANVDVLAKLDAEALGQLRDAIQLLRQAQKLRQQGKYAEAQPLLRRALTIRETVLGDDHPLTARTYNNVAVNLQDQRKYHEADELFRKALNSTQKMWGENHPETARDYSNLAINLYWQTNYVAAEPLFRRALIISQKTLGENHAVTARRYHDVAGVLEAQGKYAAAEPFFRCALAISQKTFGEDHNATGARFHNLAFNLHYQGKYAEAEPLYRIALEISQKTVGEDDTSTAETYKALAGTLGAQGKYAESEQLYRRAMAIFEKVLGEDHEATARVYNDLAVDLDSQGRHAAAEPLHRKSLAVSQKALGENHRDMADQFNNLAFNLKAQGRYADAEPLYRKALAINQKVLGDEHPSTAQSYTGLATNLHAQGKYADATQILRTGAAHFQTIRQRASVGGLDRATFTSNHSPFSLLAALLGRSNQVTDAWQALETDLARGLREDLDLRRTLTADELRRENDRRGQLDQIEKRLSALASLKTPTEEQLHRLDVLRQEDNRLRAERAQFQIDLEKKYGAAVGQVYDRARIQKQLPADTVLLAWLDLQMFPNAHDPKGDHWACLIRSSGPPLWVRLPGTGPGAAWTKEDDILPQRLRGLLQHNANDPAAWQESARRLAAQRLAPLDEHLAGVRHLIILPSTLMRGVPVEVLTDRYSISYAPSGSVYAYLQERKQATPVADNRLLALGDPVFQRNDQPKTPLEQSLHAARAGFTPLPGTRREVEVIARLFPESKTLLGSQASEQELDALARADTLKQYRYLHLATHGQAHRTPSAGSRSFLAMANDHLPDPLTIPEPGRKLFTGELRAEDMLAWNLNADLVTLSACETGLGSHEGSEGFVGFSQALFLAGARTLVLSQWKVDDTATALLMQRFYQNLLGKRPGLDKPLDKAAALAEAKRWLRQLNVEEVQQLTKELPAVRGLEVARPAPVTVGQPYAHPYYWASFILIGDPGDVSQAVPVLAPAPVAALPVNVSGRPHWPWLVGGGVVVLVGSGWLWRRSRRAPGRPA